MLTAYHLVNLIMTKFVNINYLLISLLIFCNSNLYPQNRQNSPDFIFNTAYKPLTIDHKLSSFQPLEIEIQDDNYKTQFSKDYQIKYLTYDPVRDPKRLAYNTGMFFGAALIDFAILWSVPEQVTNWNKKEIFDRQRINEVGLTGIWKENIQAGPVWDEDSFFFNWICHPWAGAVYYMSARGSGFKRWESFAYAAFVSTVFWEFGVEAVAEIPSWQDIIITPVVGSLIGEQFFKLKGKIIRNERKVLNSRFLGATSLFLMDPFNQILDGLGYKTTNKVHSFSSFVPVDYNLTTGKAIWGMQVVVNF